jgi:hypothetical protein
MKMKKKWLLIVSVLVATLAVTSCGSAPKVYDKTVPLEQSSTLILNDDVGIIKFNEEKAALMGTIIIPADSHSWILRFKDRKYDGAVVTGVTQYDISMSYTFLPEHTYHVTATANGGQVTDVTKFTTDFPTPDTTNPNASPFEGEWVSVQTDRVGLLITKDEWASKLDGKYSNRGIVSYTGGNATLVTMAGYDAKKGKWSVYSPSQIQVFLSYSSFTQKAVMKGNTLIVNDRFKYRKR